MQSALAHAEVAYLRARAGLKLSLESPRNMDEWVADLMGFLPIFRQYLRTLEDCGVPVGDQLSEELRMFEEVAATYEARVAGRESEPGR